MGRGAEQGYRERVLRLLSDGDPHHETEIARALGLDPVSRMSLVNVRRYLRRLNRTGLMTAMADNHWRLRDGIELCTCCSGRGVLHEPSTTRKRASAS